MNHQSMAMIYLQLIFYSFIHIHYKNKQECQLVVYNTSHQHLYLHVQYYNIRFMFILACHLGPLNLSVSNRRGCMMGSDNQFLDFTIILHHMYDFFPTSYSFKWCGYKTFVRFCTLFFSRMFSDTCSRIFYGTE